MHEGASDGRINVPEPAVRSVDPDAGDGLNSLSPYTFDMTTSESGETDAEESVDAAEEADRTYAVVLDDLPHGRPDDDRPQYKKSPLAYALGESAFRLLELTLAADADVSIGDRVVVEPAGEQSVVERIREVGYDDLSNAAHSELEYVVEEVVERHERRFVDFYNDAQPITLRLHQLNLLPGIGKKLRNDVLDERKRAPFESFADLEERIAGLHDPKGVLVDRILEELRDEDLKYRTFVGGGDATA
jgi:putative nucleotide binding protein